MEEHQDVANSQGISTPTICCYERKVKLTKLHVGFANPESKFKQVISNHNEALKTKLENEISIEVKPVPKSKAQRV